MEAESGVLSVAVRKGNALEFYTCREDGGVEAAACLFDAEADAIVCFCQTALGPDELTRAAKQRLPRYMIPNLWRTEKRLPVNANGKLDRAGLRERYFEKD